MLLSDPINTIFSIKRFMGISYSEADNIENLPYNLIDSGGNFSFQTSRGELSAIEISASILADLKKRAEDTLGGDLVGAVITVPAYFNDAQRQSTKDAAKISGINVLKTYK